MIYEERHWKRQGDTKYVEVHTETDRDRITETDPRIHREIQRDTERDRERSSGFQRRTRGTWPSPDDHSPQ